MTCSHHGVACGQAFQNLDLARQAQADLHRHPFRNQDFGLVSGHNLDHKGAAALRNDGLFGDHQRVVTHPEHRVDPGKHAWTQLLLAVVDAPTNTHRAAIGLDQGVHRLHDGREGSTRQGVHRQLGLLTCTDLGLKALGQTEVDQHGIDVFDVDHVGAVLEVITHVDLLETGDTVKRRQHFEALQSGIGQGQLGP